MTLEEYKANGPHAWPGGYPIYAVMADGALLCFECTTTESEVFTASDATGPDGEDPAWGFVSAEVYWEGPDDSCAHCGNALPSAYGDNQG